MSNPNSACEEPDGYAPCSVKKKRNLPGNPDPNAEVIALSPRSLMATNRFVCEICNKGFQRDQNLQLHRRGHNLPWRLKLKASHEVKKKVYVCPEESCVHHDPMRALGDLTGIKKHFSRKHGEKKWKCDRCSKRYAVQSDWKAHQKTCGTREYRCDCGTLFSRRDSFITHRAFCDALAEENIKISTLRQGESHDTTTASHDNHRHMASFIGPDVSTAMKAPSSPTSQITRDAFAYTEVSKPPFTSKSALDFTSSEGTIASPWMPAGHGSIKPTVALSSSSSSKSPGLSLYLGMGPGPGPPGSGPNLSCSGTSPFDFPSLESLHKLAFPHMASTQGYDTHIQSSSAMAGGMGMLSSIFSSPKPAYPHHDTGNSIYGGLAPYPDMSELDGPAMRQFSAQSSRVMSTASASSSMSGSMNRSKLSSHHAASSATALLQKAAQMGASASSQPSFFKKFGVGGMGETMDDQEMHRQSSWPGVSSLLSSPYSKPRQPGEAVYISSTKNDDGADADISISAPFESSCQQTLSGYGSMQEFMGFVSAGRNGSLRNAWDDPIPSSKGSQLLRHQETQTDPFQKSSSSSLTAPMHGLQREELEGDAPMVDFLGVGGSSGMVGFFANCRNPDSSGM